MSEPQPAGAATGGAAAHWQRTLWAMVGIQFVMTVANSMLTPILPLFLPALGVDSETAIDIWAGVLNGTTSFVAAFASPLWGQLADRHGRKLMLLRSSLAIGFFTALMGAAGNVWQFFGCRALMGVFAGFSSAAISLVASQVPEERLGYSLGWLYTGQLVGSLIGPIIGGILADLTGSYRIPFYVTAAMIFLTIDGRTSCSAMRQLRSAARVISECAAMCSAKAASWTSDSLRGRCPRRSLALASPVRCRRINGL